MSLFPGVSDPDTRDLLLKAAEELGLVAPRMRCSMPEFAVGSQARWSTNPVSFKHSLNLSGLSADQVRSAYEEACGEWNLVCGIQLSLAVSFANINATSGRIDGSSGTLAWSYLPSSPSGPSDQVQQLFDDQESWTYAWLKEVACHEIGHAIGLGHSPDQSALMYPYSHSGSVPRPQAWDIEEAVLRYGRPSSPAPAPAPAPVPGTPPGKVPLVSGVLLIDGVPYEVELKPQ